MKKISNKKGFTLAELLIVIAIIAILIAIAVPVFSSSMKRAQMATDDANFRDAKSMAVTSLLNGKVEAYGPGNVLQTYDLTDTTSGANYFYYLSDGHFILNGVTPPAGVEFVTAKYTAEESDVTAGKYNNAAGHVKGARIYIFCDPGGSSDLGSTATDDSYILNSDFGSVYMGFAKFD